ncbi:MAG: LysR family transcriptional regulator [Roseobacter sp.]
MNHIERPSIDSDLLRSFLTIADSGNLTTASGRLGRTQSAISVQLRKLETGLGVALFIRTPRGMDLTPAGETLLPKAQLIVDELAQASALFAEPLTGQITVGLPDDFDGLVLESVLAGFARAHPGVRVRAVSGCTSGFPEAVRNRSMDLAVYSDPDNEEGETLCVEDTVWASVSKPLFDPAGPVQLAILERSCWWKDLPTSALRSAGREYSIVFRSSSFSALQAAINAGLAVGILPASCMGSDLQALTPKEGFPRLPRSRRSFLVSKDAPGDLTTAMIAAIREAHQSLPQ